MKLIKWSIVAIVVLIGLVAAPELTLPGLILWALAELGVKK